MHVEAAGAGPNTGAEVPVPASEDDRVPQSEEDFTPPSKIARSETNAMDEDSEHVYASSAPGSTTQNPLPSTTAGTVARDVCAGRACGAWPRARTSANAP